MRKLTAVLLVGLMCGTAFISLATTNAQLVTAPNADYMEGPFVDKIYWDVKTSEETALGDVAEGDVDVFLWTTTGDIVAGLPPETLNKLNTVEAVSSYDELSINPVHDDDSPYLITATSEPPSGADLPLWHRTGTFFNPFAIREVRYALNFLISRQNIVDEVLSGFAGPMYCPVKTTEASYEPYFKSVIDSHGLTPAGDEQLGITMINDAMEAAAANLTGHTLVKGTDGFWKFDGEDLYLPILIREEDERKPIGLYVCAQLEKAGLKVEELVKPRSITSPIIWSSNPTNFDYVIYTGGWGSSYAWLYPEQNIAQMYAPWYTYMPGAGEPSWWNYQNQSIDDLTKKVVTGQIETEEEYWNLNAEAIDMGIEESARVFLVHTKSYYAANKRVTNLIADREVGLGTRWSLINMKTPDNILRVTEFSDAGKLFMSTFEPVEGLTDVYTNYMWRILRDYGTFANPDGQPVTVSTPYTITKDYEFVLNEETEEMDLVGLMDVPASAVTYDSVENDWAAIGSGQKCTTKIVYNIKQGNWHNANPVVMADVLYSLAFAWEWSSEDGSADPYYDGGFGTNAVETMSNIIGIEVLNDEQIAFYVNYIFPADDAVVAEFFGQVLQSVSFCCPGVPWEILDTMSELVASGAYVFQEDGGIDLLTAAHVADIKSKMQSLKSSGYIPDALKGTITEADAETRYTAAIKWIDDMGHALISNGPFYIHSYKASEQFLEMRRFTGELPEPSITPKKGFIDGFTVIMPAVALLAAILVISASRKKK